ncbi:NlpC/P60 family protein [Microbispora sp. NPDC049125]|uniref:NlpC/P60 family protein n=1 Tax=Microbispora sp. NPDC049125 TaxID=3154929 RepID=UPI00346746AB
MTEDASAGRLHAEVVADVSGLRRDLEAKLKTELANLKAEIKAKVAARVEVDRAQIRRELADKVAEAARGIKATVTVNVDVDTAAARAKIKTLDRTKVTVDVDANTAAARAKVAAIKATAVRPINVPVNVSAGTAIQSLGRALATASMFPAIASGLMLAAGAATNLAASLFSVASASSQAVGVLAAIPGLAGTAAQGLGALIIGFSGIGAAVKALDKAQIKQGASAAQSAAQQVNFAEQVKAARERLTRAEEDAAARVREARERVVRAEEAAAESIQSARERLASAQETAAERVATAQARLVQAQEDGADRLAAAERREAEAHAGVERALVTLDEARKDQIRRMEDLRLQVAGGKLDQEAAQIALEHAQIRLQQIMGPGSNASDLQKREADLAYRQAQQRLEEVNARQKDLTRQQKEADNDGVEGAKSVRDAQQQVTDSIQAQADAERELQRTRVDSAKDIAQAQQELAKAQRESTRDIADAQRDLARARRDGAREVADAQKAVREAQRDGARSIVDAQRALAQAMRAGSAAAGTQSAQMTNLAVAMGRLSPAGRRFAQFVKGVLLPRFREMRASVQTALLPPLQTAITRAMPLLDTIQGGLVETGKRLGDLALKGAELVRSPGFRADTAKIMKSNNRALTSFGGAALHLISALRHLAVVAGPVLLEPFARWTKQLAASADAAAKTGRKTGTLEQFLKRAKKTAKTLYHIFRDVAIAIYNVGRAGRPTGDNALKDMADWAADLRKTTADPKFQQAAAKFFEQALPVAKKFLDSFGKIFDLFLRLGEATGGGTLNGFFTVLDGIVGLLETIASLPGGGPILTALFTLSGAGLGIGLFARGLGHIVTNLGRLSKFTGLTKIVGGLLGPLTGGLGVKGAAKLTARQAGGAIKSVAQGAALRGMYAWDAVSGAVGGAARKVGGVAKRGVGAVVDKATGGLGVKGAAKLTARQAGSAVRSGVSAAGSFVSDTVGGAVGSAASKAGGAVKRVGKAAGGAVKRVGQAAGGAVKRGVGAVAKRVAERGGERGAASVAGVLGGQAVAAGIERATGAARNAAKAVGTYTGALARAGGGAILKGLGAAASAIGGVVSAAGRGVGALASLATAHGKAALAAAGQAAKTALVTIGQKLAAAATTVWTAAQKLLNLVMSNNPLGWVIKIVTLLVGALVLAYTKSETFRKIVDGAWAAIQKTIKVAWNEYILPALRGFRDFLVNTLAPKISWLYNNVIKPVWNLITGAIKVAVGLITGNFSLVKKGLDTMGNAFQTIWKVIKAAWDKVVSISKVPVRFIVDTVLNNGILKAWNNVAGFFHIEPSNLHIDLPKGFAGGGVLPGYTPGRDVHDFFSPTGGALRLSGGEAVMRPEWTRAVGEDYVRASNAAARTGGVRGVAKLLGLAGDPGPGFADGGIIGGIKSFFGKAKDFFVGGIRKAASVVVDPILNAIETRMAGSQFTRSLAAVPRRILNGFLGWLDTKEPSIGGPGHKAVALARTQIGVPYVWGGTAWNKGLDCSGLVQQAWFRAVGKLMPRTTYTQKPWLEPVSGPPREGDIGQPHPGHTFLFSGNGKIIEAPYTGARVREVPARPAWWGRPPASFLRDDGGPVYPGLNVYDNRTGGMEWILTPDAVRLLGGPDAIDHLNSEAAKAYRSRTPVAAVLPGAASGGRAAPTVVQHIHPQPRQSEQEIGAVSARKLGAMLR